MKRPADENSEARTAKAVVQPTHSPAMSFGPSNGGAHGRAYRPTATGMHGMVACAHPLAAQAGLRILTAGGNAIGVGLAFFGVVVENEAGGALGAKELGGGAPDAGGTAGDQRNFVFESQG